MMMVKDACEFRMKAALFLFSPNISLVFPAVINMKRDKQKGRLKSVFRKISHSWGEGGKRCSLQGKLPVTGISPTFKPFTHCFCYPVLPFQAPFHYILGSKRQIGGGRERMRVREMRNQQFHTYIYSHFIHLNTCTSLLEAVLQPSSLNEYVVKVFYPTRLPMN